jgi:ligand-binding SRPBCC domain-containing protein
MKIYQLYRRQSLAMSEQQAWDFFSSPYFLNQITPDFFHVDITSPVPEHIYAGLLISYRMKAVCGVPMSWLSEVCYCDEPKRFVYQQRVGPFNFWSHEVRISPENQGIVLEDLVFYTMPWGWIGELLHGMLIGKKLQCIFDTRRAYIQQKWPGSA